MAPNANARKRAIATVDLTGDDEGQPVPKTSRSSQMSSINSSQPIQSQRDAWLEEENAHETILLSQEGNNGAEETEEYELYGMDTVLVNSYYRGTDCF